MGLSEGEERVVGVVVAVLGAWCLLRVAFVVQVDVGVCMGEGG